MLTGSYTDTVPSCSRDSPAVLHYGAELKERPKKIRVANLLSPRQKARRICPRQETQAEKMASSGIARLNNYGRRGVIEAVTGTGKTMMGIFALEEVMEQGARLDFGSLQSPFRNNGEKN